jgi:prepilin-type N-terminal cleavage/methylation domain-containing protein
MKTKCNVRNAEPGFSLIELMIVVAILMIVTGGIFSQINNAQQRMHTEQSRVDNFDEARDFVDQFFRDINQIGYPNGRIIAFAPNISDARVAVGLVKIDANSIWFEGDVSGSGVVQSMQYKVNGSGTCAVCLQRSQIDKKAPFGHPLTGQDAPAWGTEVNDVINNAANPIFTYFDTTGAQIATIPADIVANPTVLASVKTIHIALTIQNNAIVDLATKQPIQSNFEGEVSLNNCSLATNGWPMSCR